MKVQSPTNIKISPADLLRLVDGSALVADTNGVVLSANPAAEQTFSKGDKSLAGLSLGDIFMQADGSPLNNFKVFSDTDVSVSFKIREGNQAGMTFRVSVISLAGAGEDEKLMFRFQSAKQSSHPVNYDLFLQQAPVAIYTTDRDGRITFFNQRAAELWGREPDIGVDKWCGSFEVFSLSGEEIEMADWPITVALKEQRPVFGYEVIIGRPDGSKRHVLPYPMPLYDTMGMVTGAINMLIDTTYRRERQEDLMRFAAIVESSEDAIISKTLNSVVTSWNPAAERIFGYTEEEMVGESILKLLPPDLLSEEDLILAKLRKGERIEHYDTVRMTKDGRRLFVSLTISPVKDHTGRVIGASKIVRDISSRKESERFLAEKSEALEKINAELSQFAYVISHDLKAPLRAISSISHFLLQDYEDKLGPEGVKHLQLLDSRIHRMGNLIQGLLEYSRIGKQEEKITEVNTQALVKDIWKILGPPENMKLELGHLPVIEAQQVPLHHIFQNLLSNAVKYNDATNPFVKVDCKVGPTKYTFSVSDNGPGIEEKYHEKVFGIFQTLTPRDEVESTGIGLTIVKKAVEDCGGKVWIESKPGDGATFFFSIPKIRS